MDDVLKSGHFSILTISICAVFVQNVSRSYCLLDSMVTKLQQGMIQESKNWQIQF